MEFHWTTTSTPHTKPHPWVYLILNENQAWNFVDTHEKKKGKTKQIILSDSDSDKFLDEEF